MLCTYVCSMNMFYTSPRRTDRSTTILQCSLKSSMLTPKIYSLRNIFPNGLPISAQNRPSFVPVYVSVLGLGLTDRSQPMRSSACSADAADVELVSQQEPHFTLFSSFGHTISQQRIVKTSQMTLRDFSMK